MIFNKSNNGSEELYQLSGTFQAATQFNSVMSEVEAAQLEVAAIVGPGVVAAAESLYLGSGALSNTEKQFVTAVQKPIAFLAIYFFSRQNGVSHGDTGRKLKIDDNEKIPFEWMLDRDDRAMRERYYRALDSLFSLLTTWADLPSAASEAWKNSEVYKAAEGCFVKTIGNFEQVYPIEHSYYMFYKMLPLLLEVQNGNLTKLIGESKVEQLVSGSSCGAFFSQALKVVVLEAIIIAVERWSIVSFPLEVARRFSPSYQGNKASQPATNNEIDWYLNKLSLQLKAAKFELTSVISGNPYEGMRLIPDNSPKKKYFTV